MLQLDVFYVMYKQSNKTGFKLKYLSMVKKKVSQTQVQRGTILWTKTYTAFIWKYDRILNPIPTNIWGRNGEQRQKYN